MATFLVALGASLFFGGLWPCVPLMVPAEHVGLAFGEIGLTAANLGLFRHLSRRKLALLVYS